MRLNPPKNFSLVELPTHVDVDWEKGIGREQKIKKEEKT